MPAGDQEQPRNPQVDEDVAGKGGEGRRSAEATPPIGEDADREQTQTPPLEGDVGVPPEEERRRPEK